MRQPTITVILPRRANDSAEQAIQAVLRSDYPQHLIEIIEAIGESPSRQRNRAAQQSRGDLLYFLDNDSIVPPSLFSRIVSYYQDFPAHPDHTNTLAGVGGPNLTPDSDGFLQHTFGYALASPFAHFKMCARYKPTGGVREAGEKELILCNLSIRREVFLQEQGFDEQMYPNEENEFINRVMEKGYRFLYDPKAFLYRSRRNHFWGFVKQLFHYGGGRADQILVEGLSLKSFLFFLPMGLLGYLLALLAVVAFGGLVWWMLLPLFAYGSLACVSALRDAMTEHNPYLLPILPFWSMLMHVAYGSGMACGFIQVFHICETHAVRGAAPVEIVVRKPLGEAR